MAGTLSVQQIQGLASAADPTTVTISSGHTLYAPGHVIQMKRAVTNNVTSVTSNAFVNHMSAQFDNTPVVGSLVIASVSVTAYRNPAANWGSHCAIWIGSEGMSSGDTSIIPAGRSGYAGEDNYGSQGVVGDNLGTAITSTGHKTITSSHVSGGNPTFYFKVNELGGQTSYWGSAGAYTSQAYATDLTSMILYEVAQ